MKTKHTLNLALNPVQNKQKTMLWVRTTTAPISEVILSELHKSLNELTSVLHSQFGFPTSQLLSIRGSTVIHNLMIDWRSDLHLTEDQWRWYFNTYIVNRSGYIGSALTRPWIITENGNIIQSKEDVLLPSYHSGTQSLDVFGNTAPISELAVVDAAPSSFLSYLLSLRTNLRANCAYSRQNHGMAIWSNFQIPDTEISQGARIREAHLGAESQRVGKRVLDFNIKFGPIQTTGVINDPQLADLFPKNQTNLRQITTLLAATLQLGRNEADELGAISTRYNLVSQTLANNTALYAKVFYYPLIAYRIERENLGVNVLQPDDNNTEMQYINLIRNQQGRVDPDAMLELGEAARDGLFTIIHDREFSRFRMMFELIGLRGRIFEADAQADRMLPAYAVNWPGIPCAYISNIVNNHLPFEYGALDAWNDAWAWAILRYEGNQALEGLGIAYEIVYADLREHYLHTEPDVDDQFEDVWEIRPEYQQQMEDGFVPDDMINWLLNEWYNDQPQLHPGAREFGMFSRAQNGPIPRTVNVPSVHLSTRGRGGSDTPNEQSNIGPLSSSSSSSGRGPAARTRSRVSSVDLPNLHAFDRTRYPARVPSVLVNVQPSSHLAVSYFSLMSIVAPLLLHLNTANKVFSVLNAMSVSSVTLVRRIIPCVGHKILATIHQLVV